MNNLTVKIAENLFLYSFVNLLIWVISIECRLLFVVLIILAEAIEGNGSASAGTIESSLNRDNPAKRIIFHIVAENHQLRNIDETAEFLVREALEIHSLAFCNDAAMIVRLLNLNENERKSIYK